MIPLKRRNLCWTRNLKQLAPPTIVIVTISAHSIIKWESAVLHTEHTNHKIYICMTRWKNWKVDKSLNNAETTKLCVIRKGIVFFRFLSLPQPVADISFRHFRPSKIVELSQLTCVLVYTTWMVSNTTKTLKLNIWGVLSQKCERTMDLIPLKLFAYCAYLHMVLPCFFLGGCL